MTTALLVAVVAIALVFDFVNGFHDAANSIATVVATRVLKPWQAVIWAAFWNFIAFVILPLKVANEVAKIIDSSGTFAFFAMATVRCSLSPRSVV